MVAKLNKLSPILLLLIIFLVPLLPASFGLGYEQIKILFFILSTSLIGFFLVLGKHRLEWDAIKIASVFFILTLFIASILGRDLKASFLGNSPYFQGWIVYAYLFLFSLLISVSRLKLKWIALAFTLGSLVVSAAAIKDWLMLTFFNAFVPTYAGRVVSTFGQPNFYSGFLLMTLPFAYYLFRSSNDRLRYLGLGSGSVSFTGIFISYSRTAILLAAVLFLLGLIWQFKAKSRIKLIVFVVAGATFLTTLSLSLGIVEKEISQPISAFNPDLTKASIEKRAYIWPVTLGIALQKPLVGYGLENISTAFTSYFQTNKHSLFEENLNISPVLISFKELNVDRSHNYILDILLFSGILGLLGWLGLLGVLFNKLRQNYHGCGKNVLIVSLIIYLVWIQFQNQSIVHLVYFWLIVGLLGRDVDKATDK